MEVRTTSGTLSDLPEGTWDHWERLECRLAATESRLSRAERRLGTTWACAFIGIVGAFVLGLSPEARAQFGVTLVNLNTRLTAVESKTQFVSVSGGQMYITGANLHIRSGSGTTEGAVNGLGNLIIGYNEMSGGLGNERGGSHNLVVGNFHDYTSFGGLIAGQRNRISGPFASVTGGVFNTASNTHASVSGGAGNQSSGFQSSVSGGQFNTASNNSASVSGGENNNSTGFASSVSGGNDRDIVGTDDWRAGGLFQDF